MVFDSFQWFSLVFNSFQQFSTVLVAYMRSIHRDVVCEPNWWATWLACSPNMWLKHCSLCLVQTGLFSCKPCLKYSRINGTKVQSHIECVKGRQFLMVFNGFQWFSTVLVAYMMLIHRDVVCEPNQWAAWLSCSPNM